MRPNTTIHDAESGETITREMTEQEYADLLATGWTMEPPETVEE